jgi:tetratricopeptide (TPR) repeat protein
MFDKTKQFKWRQRIGVIKMAQLSRMERLMRADAQRDPEMKKEYMQFLREKAMTELQEYKLIVENYPTDTTARFEVARRLYALGQYQEAIPVFQHVRGDPKYRIRASVLLGQAFLSSGYTDEAVDTLKAALDEYPAQDDRSKEMSYWYGRALETKGDAASAIKQFSKVAQLDFNYLDVQERIKRLRGGGPPK